MKSLRVATCQFAVENSAAKNRREILALVDEAADGGAQVAHFSEAALTGYPGLDMPDFSQIDWQEVADATREIAAAAKQRGIWVLLGSSHPLGDGLRPHNSIYVINNKGKIVDRYDKRFCTGTAGKRPTMDLVHYTPGNRTTTFKIAGVTCAALICYDYRFPELFRELSALGVKIVFQSFHNARKMPVADQKYNIWRTIVPATMCCRAAENHFWISAANTQARPSQWASFAVRPDGAIVGELKLHKRGVLLTDMAIDPNLYDAPGPWRSRAIAGILHSGELVEHPRSQDRTCL